MQLRVFQSDKGDCLLLTGADGTRILVDGGMESSYTEHVAPGLARIARDGGRLDLVYLSHIDKDHIAGVVALMDDLVAWRVRDFQEQSGNDHFRDPARPRPPEVARIWHNAFHDQVGDNAGEISDMLAASAPVLEAGGPDEHALAESYRRLEQGVADAVKLTHRVGGEQLRIPVNAEFDRKLITVRNGQKAVELGSLALTVVGPFQEDLDKLRKEWNEWLATHQSKVAEIRDRMHGDSAQLGAGEVELFGDAMALRARELFESTAELRKDEMGNREKVTTPNLASLMLLVDEGDKTLLLTGDGHWKDILKGLRHAGRIGEDGIHLRVLKLQHHGSEHNIHEDFCRQVTADHYVICANGADENPDLRSLELIFDSRLGPDAKRSANPAADGKFKVWINSSSSATATAANKEHLRKVERLVQQRAQQSGGRMTFEFLDKHSFDVPV